MFNIEDNLNDIWDTLEAQVDAVEEIQRKVGLMEDAVDPEKEFAYGALLESLSDLKTDLAAVLEEGSYISNDFKYIRKDLARLKKD